MSADDRRRGLLLALASPLLPRASRAAGTGFELPPAPPPARPPAMPALQQQTLANGLTLVTVQRRALPLVSATLLLRTGAEADPPGRAGAAAMMATLLAKGARRGGKAVGAMVLASQAEALGSALDTGSGWQLSRAGMTVAVPELAAALALLADVVRHPLLLDEELERARAQALDGLRVTLRSPSSVSAWALRRAFWGGSPYGAVTTPATLRRLALDDVRQFHARWVRPENAVLVLAGDIAAGHARALAERLFGDWQVDRREPTPAPASAATPIDAPLVMIDLPGSGQVNVGVAAPFVGSGSADDRAALAVGLVANAVLGGGYSARLNRQVRIRRGLSYGAFSEVEVLPPGGMLSAGAQTRPADVAQVLQLLRGEILRLADAPPDAAELSARQAALLGSFSRRLDTVGGLSALVVGQLLRGQPLDALGGQVDALLAVTPQQVRDFARDHWHAATLRAVVAGDLGDAGAALAAAEPRALRLAVGELDLGQPGLRRAG